MDTVKFAAKLSLLSALLYATPLLNADFLWLREIIASHSVAALNAIGQHASRDGTLLIVNGAEIAITRDCVPWKLALFVFSLFAITSIPLKKKLFYWALFIPAIYSLNIARVAALSYSSVWGEQAFWSLHFALQITLIAFSVGYWFFSTNKSLFGQSCL